MREKCPFANEGCKYFNNDPPPELRDKQEHGCFRDTHHMFFPKEIVARLGRDAVRMNNALTVQLCRAEHDTYHSKVPFNLPTYAQLEAWRANKQ